jgi:tetratricopeptide (TPR) repeat protein
MKTALGLVSSIIILCVFIVPLSSAEPMPSGSLNPLEYAKSLGEGGKIDESVEQYLIYYTDNPENHTVLQWISELYERNGRMKEAIEYAELFLVSGEESLMSDYYFQEQCNRLWGLWDKVGAGRILRATGKAGGIELAREHYLTATANADTERRLSTLAHVMLGDIENKANSAVKAREHYRAALAIISPPAETWDKAVNRVLGRKFISMDWLDDALAAYRNCPYSGHLMELGGRLERDGRGFEMLELYENDLLFERHEKDEDRIGINRFIEDLDARIINELIRVGRGPSLVKSFRDRIAECHADFKLHRNLGYLLFKMNQYDEGLSELEMYLAARTAVTASDYQWVGNLCKTAKMTDEAIAYYEAARSMDVTEVEIRRESMMSQMAATKEYWKARFTNRLLETLGALFMEKGQWANAEACYKEIREFQPSWSNANTEASLARIWEHLGKENVVIENLKNDVVQHPLDADLRVKFGQSLWNAGKLDDAIAQFEKAVELSGEDVSIRLKLAELLAKNKQQKKAVAEYENVLYTCLKKPKDQFHLTKGADDMTPWAVLHRLAELCKRTGEKDKLLEIYDTVLAMSDSPETVWKADEFILSRILRDITEILYAKGEYNRIAERWLDYREKLGYYARSVITDNIRSIDLRAFVKQLQELTSADPDDTWGWFILADLLMAENRNEEALQIYLRLLAETPPGGRVHHDLAYVFQRMNRYDLTVDASIKYLEGLNEGSRDYGRQLGQIADFYLKLSDNKNAADYYRNAICCEVSAEEHQRYQQGLFKATDGKEGTDRFADLTVEPMMDLRTMRLQAESLLKRQKEYGQAAALYEQILEKAPTDINSMVALGDAYRGLGRIDEATALYEKVTFDKTIRVWAHGASYYGADSALESIYRRNNDIYKQIKLFALTPHGSFSEIRGRLKSREEFEEFHTCLLEQFEQTPENLKLRFYLIEHYHEIADTSKASEILEKLKNELADKQGNIRNASHAIQLAKAFEKLGRFEEALAILPVTDYETTPDNNQWIGDLLMRLNVKAGKLEKALEICHFRLKKDPQGYRTIEIAEQLGQAVRSHVDGDRLIGPFLQDLAEQMPAHHHRRFCSAVKAYLAAYPTDREGKADVRETLSLLKEGRRVQVPNDCRSFADFLEQLACQADTIATQSFMDRYGQGRRAPRLGFQGGSAFEVLAAALDGTDIPFDITQEGYWAFYESGDKNKKYQYGANGGVICSLSEVNRFADQKTLNLSGRVFFAPEVIRNIASIQSACSVVEAIDNRGRKVPIPEVKTRWNDSTHIEIILGNQQPPAQSITRLRVKTAAAVGIEWITFKIDRLDHCDPVIAEIDGVRIQVFPIEQVTWATAQAWQIPIVIHRDNSKLDSGPITELKSEIYFITNDGQRHKFGYSGFLSSSGFSKIAPRPAIGAFDPATTSMVIRQPASIEIIPFELTFKDIPIIDR